MLSSFLWYESSYFYLSEGIYGVIQKSLTQIQNRGDVQYSIIMQSI